ncbi:MAG: cyclic nucleotide-binding domain-containing protein [Anaerolineales bacterium]|nr:cyclic nucleotide-binding domain-containing protein [Anaerolineales bacterium]
MMPTNPDRLTRYTCFRALTEDQRQAVAQLAREECFYPGHILFQDEKPGTHLYMLATGEVEVLYNVGEDNPTHVDALGEGEILGCSSLIDPYMYSSTARCLSEIETLVLDAEELRKLMEKDCQIGYSIQKHIIQMLLDRILELRFNT